VQLSFLMHEDHRCERVEYEFCLRGHLGERWESWFDGLRITVAYSPDGTPVTTLQGSIADQAALHGVFAKIRDIGMPILAVRRLDPICGCRAANEREGGGRID
jgi:hypothetical protein